MLWLTIGQYLFNLVVLNLADFYNLPNHQCSFSSNTVVLAYEVGTNVTLLLNC